jgi:hypothetical protein
MAVSYPYTLPVLADRLKIQKVSWSIQRNDEMSGGGDGRVWQAELAPPLWMATIELCEMDLDQAEAVAALIRKLHGAQESFLLYNPARKYPAADPTGALLGSAYVTVAAVGGNTISLAGLPAGYMVSLGDKMSITYAGARVAFLEASETVAANGAGATGAIEVFPHVPVGVQAGQAVTLVRPACKCFIMPGTHNPGSGSKMTVTGAGFKALQRP